MPTSKSGDDPVPLTYEGFGYEGISVTVNDDGVTLAATAEGCVGLATLLLKLACRPVPRDYIWLMPELQLAPGSSPLRVARNEAVPMANGESSPRLSEFEG